MKAQVRSVETAHGGVRVSRDAVLPTAKSLASAIGAAKDWRRRAATVVSLTPGIAHHFVPTGSSTKRLGASIEDLLPRVSAKETVAHGGGPLLAKEGKAALVALRAASGAHATATDDVSPDIRALNTTKGVLYEELSRVARAARLVAPVEASLYAPSTHLNTAKKGRAKKAKPSAAAPAGGAAPAKAV